MKKVLILLIIITIGLAGLNVYEFLNMQSTTKQYEDNQNKYHDLLNEEIENNKKIDLLNEELDKLKQENINTNKEYEIWMSLNKTVQELLK